MRMKKNMYIYTYIFRHSRESMSFKVIKGVEISTISVLPIDLVLNRKKVEKSTVVRIVTPITGNQIDNRHENLYKFMYLILMYFSLFFQNYYVIN